MVKGGPEGSGIRPAVSFAFDLRFSALKKWEQDAQRQKKGGGRGRPLWSLSAGRGGFASLQPGLLDYVFRGQPSFRSRMAGTWEYDPPPTMPFPREV